ncbi:MAG TPA: ABC transporter substrate-binding protein, partial [Mycobacteriales bacterium]|nr:ABC transporter substrate-binding protein [Mycobacteriales bacterium]
LEQGRIDAAWLVEPFLSAAMASGARPVLWNYAEADPRLIIAGYFTSNKLRQQNPGLVKRFLSATQKSMVYAQSHPNEVRQILTTYAKLTADQTKAVVLPRYSPTMDQTVLGHIANLVKKYGLTKTTPDVTALTGQ